MWPFIPLAPDPWRLRHTDPDHLVTPELVWIAAYGKRHRFTFFERCFETLLILVDFDLEAAAAPLNSEGQSAPIRRQLRIDGKAITSQG